MGKIRNTRDTRNTGKTRNTGETRNTSSWQDRGMQKKRLGASDLEITPIGVGAWAMGGGGWQFAWGAQDDQESVDAIHAALDKGINWIDTAAIYGLGHSEEVVARALAGCPRNRWS